MSYEPQHARPSQASRARPAVVTAACLGITAWALGSTPAASASEQAPLFYLDRDVSAYAQQFIGGPYDYGGTTPAGFDCSGLAQYVYANFGYQIPRTAEEQFEFFKQIPESEAWGGDLVFFHDASGYVYHTGIYEGGDGMVSALDYYYGIKQTPIDWAGTYFTFGTITH